MSGDSRRFAAQTCRSVCVSALFVLAAVLLFALLIKIFNFSSAVIMPVNQIIKLLAVAGGCILCLREKPVPCGALAGACTAIVTYFLFSAVAGSLSFDWGNVADVFFGALAGAIGGAIAGIVRGGR